MISATMLTDLFGDSSIAPCIIDRLAISSRITVSDKGDMIYEAGIQKAGEMIFLRKGLIRTYIYKADGSEFTDGFAYNPGQLLHGYTEGLPLHPLNIESLKRTEVVRIPYTAVEEILSLYPDFYKILLGWMAEILNRSMEERIMMQNSTALERLRWLQHYYPGLIETAPNGYIASFLNMTPVTLSRMRGKLREEKEGR